MSPPNSSTPGSPGSRSSARASARPRDVLVGTVGGDNMTGGQLQDELYGGLGHDLPSGGSGADILVGGIGNDTLIGALGQDQLLGGDGDDLLVERSQRSCRSQGRPRPPSPA